MKSTVFGYTQEQLSDIVCQMLLSGQGATPQKLFEVDAPEQGVERLRKALKASELWELHGDTVYNVFGIAFKGIASWGPGLTIRMAGRDHRFKVLHLDRFGRRMVYLLPAVQVGNLSGLPRIDLSHDEVKLLLQMADDLIRSADCHEYFMKIKTPAVDTIVHQTAAWSKEAYDEADLLALLSQDPMLWEAAVTALDAQLRSFKRLRDAPQGITNFILPTGSAAAEKWVFAILQALTFSNEQGILLAGPIELRLKETADLRQWRNSYGRMVILRTATGALLAPLVEQAEEMERIRKCGGHAPRGFPTAPISLSRAALCCSQAADIQLAKDMRPPTFAEQDLLRAAMSRALSKDIAQRVYQRWKRRLAERTAYRLPGLHVWRSILRDTLAELWFSDAELRIQALALCEDAQEALEAAQKQREDTLARAYELLSHPERYKQWIMDRPASKQVCMDKLSDEAMAFHYIPQKGKDHGVHLLAFSKASLLRLLNTVGLDESLYDAFIDLCGRNGLLDQEKRTITLGAESFCAVTFFAEKG